MVLFWTSCLSARGLFFESLRAGCGPLQMGFLPQPMLFPGFPHWNQPASPPGAVILTSGGRKDPRRWYRGCVTPYPVLSRPSEGARRPARCYPGSARRGSFPAFRRTPRSESSFLAAFPVSYPFLFSVTTPRVQHTMTEGGRQALGSPSEGLAAGVYRPHSSHRLEPSLSARAR